MHAPHHSFFKDQPRAEAFFARWVGQLEALNHCTYQRHPVSTVLGTTVVWSLNAERRDWPALLILPGFRTGGLFWDFDNNLAPLKATHRIFMVDVNGQPSLSDGRTPPVKSLDYGHWLADLLDRLGLDQVAVAGASFGSLLGIKLAQVAPQRVRQLVLMNPGCLQPFSLAPRNLYYNLLPLAFPSEANVRKFLQAAVLHPPEHGLTAPALQLLVDYELFAITEYRDHTPKPYAMPPEELARVTVPVDMLLGDKDILFPCQKSLRVARRHLPTLRTARVLPNIGHGIETSPVAMAALAALLR
ncbi:alpha/beta hydrolase [Hymenobacter sp. ASUV-10]|uniref:Alpha/beta hydrolase n=1 Tax=Hymenobacter aranciens TaxID=3063996 RepID=A0ABT9BF36_9BACT|nr:alpha/beta hydrolase [Hymenobacter sp. ASUV-10]MDO7875276.1 alpha/beta hydrolase [Hymenobacter sp. ASUV-10]